jgi:ABC-type bacteriocin/lantibiotic exporter with double-glycine peptidase domain
MKGAPCPLDAATLLQRALAAHGVQASASALLEACSGNVSLSAFAECVRQQGLEAELVPLQDGDVAFLPVGAIVALRGGELATLVAHHPAGWSLETASGRRYRATKRCEAQPKTALQIRGAPPEGKGFLGRVAFRMRGEPHVTRAVTLSFVLGVVLLGLGLAGPLVTHAALGSALPDRAENKLALVAQVTALLGVQMAYVGWLRRRALLYLATRLSEKATFDVVSHMLRQPFATLRKVEIGRVLQATSSAATAAEAIPTLAPQLVDAVLGAAFLAYTFFLDPLSGVITAAAGVFVIGGGLVNGRWHLARKRALLGATRSEQEGLHETIVGIETVKSESVEGRMLARWLDRLVVEEQAALRLRLTASSFGALLAAIDRVVFAAVLLLLARRCLAMGASVADLVVAVQASASFMSCAQKLALLPAALADYRGDVERADEALAEPVEDEGGARRPSDANGPALVLRDVWFRYEPDSPWVLAGLNLVVERGETVILSWPSGAGKSTLLRLLSGLLAPSRGDVLVFGSDAARARRMITYVPQQAALFPMSVMDNLRILSGSVSARRILAAAEATGLLDVVADWGMGMETIITLGGANISSGQKQLILFTAAVASDTPFLMLDEALAHVDLTMRARLGAANLFRDRTVIAVVHDASPREAAHARVVALA